MKRKSFRLLSVLVGLALAAFTPLQTGFVIPAAAQADASDFTLRFSDLDFSTSLNLGGPYQETAAVFELPADWALSAPLQLELRLRSDFQSLMQAFSGSPETENPAGIKGIFEVYLNDNLVTSAELDTSGETALSFEVDPAWVAVFPNQNTLRISWDAADACAYGVTSKLYLNADSTLRFTYTQKQVNVGLRDFPKPFYSEKDIQPHPVTLLVPADSDEASLSALLAVAAGLGKHSQGQLDYSIKTSDQVSLSDLQDSQLILIGKLDAWRSYLAGSGLGAEALQLPSGMGAEDGLLLLRPSPWNDQRALLLVSGESEAGLKKASASLAAVDFLPYAHSQMAVISQLAGSSVQAVIDLTMDDLLSTDNLLVENLGDTTFTIPFNMPADANINPEAYIEVYFRHSQLIDYLQSSLTISINGSKIGSVRFSDQSAENGLARIILPPNIIQPLKNTLEITTSIVPQDLCADERSGNFWVSVLGDSYLHLPPVLEEGGGQAGGLFLDDFPQALLTDETLSTLTFVSAAADWQSWQYAADLAFQLGTYSAASQLQPSAAFLEGSAQDLSGQSLVLIGSSGTLGASVWKDVLPLAFEADGSLSSLTFNGIQFLSGAEQDLGVLQIARQSENDAALYCIAGNSAAGLRTAVAAAQAYLENKPATSANVAVIDGENNTHYLTLEKAGSAAADVEDGQLHWYERILGQNMEKANFYLLAGSVLLTALFILWMFMDKTKK